MIVDVCIHDNAGPGIDAPGLGLHEVGVNLRLVGVDIRRNTQGIYAARGKLAIEDSSVSQNDGNGIAGLRKFKLVRTDVEENGFCGVLAQWGGGAAFESSVVLNGRPPNHADIVSVKRPRLATSRRPVLVVATPPL